VRDYSLGDVARILKVSPRRLRYWKKTRLVASPAAPGDAEGYGFRDLVALRTIVSMIERGIPVQRIRRQIEILRDRLPELADPAGALRIPEAGSEQIVLRRDGRWEEVGGQLVFEFGASAGEGATMVMPLAAPDSAAARTAVDGETDAIWWFEKGCALDVDPRRHGEAAQAYEKAIELDPGYADAYCNLGAVRYNQGQRQAAREAFEACLACLPDHVEASFNLANVLEEAGEDDRALTLYRRALAVDPLYPDLHINLALLYEKLGRMRPACGHWRRYLQIDAQGSWATVARERIAREQGGPAPVQEARDSNDSR
jgi:DNA-binding transcriptional MerR regulator/Flp pilus assembly protein TadD